MRLQSQALSLLLSAGLCLALPASIAAPAQQSKRIADALDRAEIVELSANFDNALDAEDKQKFLDVFASEGVLQGFWGQSRGPAQLGQAFDFMLSTFSKDKRHVVTNHQISIIGNKATMLCYLTVFDRKQLGVTGTAVFRDELIRTGAGWRFSQRTLAADPNVDPIIAQLKSGTK